MELLKNIGLGIAGVALLYFGAEYLIKGGVSIAKKLGVSPLLIGLTLVAFGTSAPELVVSIQAALSNKGDIAVGNVVGSNICNVALILGLCALLKPIVTNEKLFKLDMPLLMGASILFAGFYFADGRGINFWQGAVMFSILIVYLVWSFYQDKKSGGGELAEAAEEEAGAKPYPVWLALIMVVGGLAGLVLGARCFVGSATYFAKAMGVSEAVIGLTIVALGTSLPELATSVVAVIKNERDIAVGNVVGSNIFNIIFILGFSSIIAPMSVDILSIYDIIILAGISVVAWIFAKTKSKVSRGEGLIMLGMYAVYFVYILLR